MPCYKPLHGFRSKTPTANGKFGVVFNVKLGYADLPLTVPCGQCVGCRLERSRQWAIRCVHESQLHERSSFVTLTFDNQWLPYDRSLDVSVLQRFMKRLRKRFGAGIRFYACGEYGEQFGRPHYHILLFGLDFSDKRVHKTEKNGTKLYTSKMLSAIWSDPDTGMPYGHAIIGDVTFESAAYVARYIMKKINGDLADRHYRFIDPETGEIFDRKPEFNTMSRRPGIAHGWYDKFKDDVYPRDYVVFKGKKFLPPKYYDRQYEFSDPSEYSLIKSKRIVNAKKKLDDNTPDRLSVKERVALARLSQLTRGVDRDL